MIHHYNHPYLSRIYTYLFYRKPSFTLPQPFPTSIMLIRDQPDSLSASNLALPRLLCLHGGGTNARIFYSQTRALRAQLRSQFRF